MLRHNQIYLYCLNTRYFACPSSVKGVLDNLLTIFFQNIPAFSGGRKYCINFLYISKKLGKILCNFWQSHTKPDSVNDMYKAKRKLVDSSLEFFFAAHFFLPDVFASLSYAWPLQFIYCNPTSSGFCAIMLHKFSLVVLFTSMKHGKCSSILTFTTMKAIQFTYAFTTLLKYSYFQNRL